MRGCAAFTFNRPTSMQAGDKIHHIAFSYGTIELVLGESECLAYFQEFEQRDLEPMYLRMEELYGRPFARVANQGLQLVEVKDFHNCTATGIF